MWISNVTSKCENWMWKSNVNIFFGQACTKNVQKIRNVNMFRKYVEFQMWKMCCFYATWCFFMLLQVQKIWQNWMWKSNVNIFFVQACPKNIEKNRDVNMCHMLCTKCAIWTVKCGQIPTWNRVMKHYVGAAWPKIKCDAWLLGI